MRIKYGRRRPSNDLLIYFQGRSCRTSCPLSKCLPDIWMIHLYSSDDTMELNFWPREITRKDNFAHFWWCLLCSIFVCFALQWWHYLALSSQRKFCWLKAQTTVAANTEMFPQFAIPPYGANKFIFVNLWSRMASDVVVSPLAGAGSPSQTRPIRNRLSLQTVLPWPLSLNQCWQWFVYPPGVIIAKNMNYQQIRTVFNNKWCAEFH